MRIRSKFIACVITAIVVLPVVFGGVTPPGPEFTTDFMLQHCNLVPTGNNLFWTLEPGTTFLYEGDDDGVLVELEIKVLDQTKVIPFTAADGTPMVATTRVIREREWEDGELVEVSRNFFARCTKTSNIFYFGERVNIFDGEIVTHEGEWLAGENGAQPGMIMPALYTLGSRYFQEIAPGVAMDRAKHTGMGLTITTPAGTFEDCIEVTETTPLEPGSQSIKYYAPGVGLIQDGSAQLVEIIEP